MRLTVDLQQRIAAHFRLDVSFDLESGTLLIVGPSGSGKSSLLACIAGYARPDDGRIALGSETLFDSNHNVNQRIEARGIGFVHQQQLLFPHLSIEANLRYGLRRRGGLSGELIDFESAVELLHVRHLLSRYPRNLSGGERQRVAVGRAMLSRPRLLLLDEPLVSVDAPLRNQIFQQVRQLVNAANVTTLIATHSPEEFGDWGAALLNLHCGTAKSP